MKRFNLQLFAELDDIISTHAEAFEGSQVKDSFGEISSKLSDLGYEVLINNKKQAEFIPSSRLGEVVSQRDNFKGKVEELNAQLLTLQQGAGDNEALKAQVQEMMNQNTTLLADLETTRVNAEIMLEAKDAINGKDILMFINKDNITTNAKGETLGIEAEVARIRTERPYLFTVKKNAGGTDPQNPGNNAGALSGMNGMIRKAAGRR